ncbi:MAG: MarR family transcriptional regulator [Hyphococcus sp.]|nr:MAG: MarR family transcriptional regulator [Marinicaulis sp.]
MSKINKKTVQEKPSAITQPSLPGDPAIFKLLTEIDIIAHLAKNEFESILPKGLSVAQFGVLNHLVRLDVMETITELANAFQVTQPTMSSTIKRMLESGYVETVPDPNDQRIKRIRVTRAGKSVRSQTIRSLNPYFEKLQQDCPAIDWQKIIPALTQLRDYLDQRRIK